MQPLNLILLNNFASTNVIPRVSCRPFKPTAMKIIYHRQPWTIANNNRTNTRKRMRSPSSRWHRHQTEGNKHTFGPTTIQTTMAKSATMPRQRRSLKKNWKSRNQIAWHSYWKSPHSIVRDARGKQYNNGFELQLKILTNWWQILYQFYSISSYYADEGLNCEVFHYCQETSKHSWICPEGFTFHQVHLICMPPSGDNICEQSSKYHVVNDYLYKPINMEEHETRPNVTLKYSERYYPESFYTDERRDRDDYSHEQRRQPVSLCFGSLLCHVFIRHFSAYTYVERELKKK